MISHGELIHYLNLKIDVLFTCQRDLFTTLKNIDGSRCAICCLFVEKLIIKVALHGPLYLRWAVTITVLPCKTLLSMQNKQYFLPEVNVSSLACLSFCPRGFKCDQ